MKVYLDNASTTKVDERVIEEMVKVLRDNYSLPSSEFIHTPGQIVKDLLDSSRNKVASFINANYDEIIFTSGGTEATNLAIKGIAFANENKGRHILTSKIEGRAVLDSLRSLKGFGFEVEEVGVDKEGFIDLEELERLIRKDTILVSIQLVNDEVGTVQPYDKIVEIVKSKNPEILIHADGTYAVGWMPIDVKGLGVDALSLTAHKIHGPKGVGALYLRKGVKAVKQIDGGYFEFNLRGGTPNIPGIVGFAKALEIVDWNEIERVKELRDYFYRSVMEQVEEVNLLGSSDFSKRHPANLNLTFKYVEGESIVLYMDMKGIAVISGSACFSRGLEPSYVILAMGHSHEDAHGSVRFSFSKYNTKEEVDYTVGVLKDVIKTLRELSPLGGN